jgi:hypothetical protein
MPANRTPARPPDGEPFFWPDLPTSRWLLSEFYALESPADGERDVVAKLTGRVRAWRFYGPPPTNPAYAVERIERATVAWWARRARR